LNIWHVYTTGSSREFKGFSREVDRSVVQCIWERAGEFFPAMKNVSFDIDQNTQIRIGHRPYSKFLNKKKRSIV